LQVFERRQYDRLVVPSFMSYSSCDAWSIGCRLFVDSQKLSDDVLAHLKTENMSVTILPCTDVATHLANLVSRGADGTEKIWVLFYCTELTE